MTDDERDSARYRWLRKNADPNKGDPFIAIYNGSFTAWTLEGADEKIDKAMATADGEEADASSPS